MSLVEVFLSIFICLSCFEVFLSLVEVLLSLVEVFLPRRAEHRGLKHGLIFDTPDRPWRASVRPKTPGGPWANIDIDIYIISNFKAPRGKSPPGEKFPTKLQSFGGPQACP